MACPSVWKCRMATGCCRPIPATHHWHMQRGDFFKPAGRKEFHPTTAAAGAARLRVTDRAIRRRYGRRSSRISVSSRVGPVANIYLLAAPEPPGVSSSSCRKPGQVVTLSRQCCDRSNSLISSMQLSTNPRSPALAQLSQRTGRRAYNTGACHFPKGGKWTC